MKALLAIWKIAAVICAIVLLGDIIKLITDSI